MESACSLPGLHWGCYEPYPTYTNDVSYEPWSLLAFCLISLEIL